MAKLLAFLQLIAISFTTYGWVNSNNPIDSLKQIEKSATHDSIRLKILSEIAIAYTDSAYSKCIENWKKALTIANKLKDRQQMGDIHHQIGYALYNQGEFNSALQEYNNALSVYQFIDNQQEVARIYNDIGLVYKTWGKYEQAIEYFMNGLRIFDEIDDGEGVGMIANNVGQIHFFQEDYKTAIKYFNTYLTANEKSKRPKAIAGASNNIAAAYMELKDYDLALNYYNKSLNIYDSLGIAIGVAILSDNIGMLKTNKSQYHEALEYHFKALELFRSLNSQSRLSYTLKNIGVAYYLIGDYNNSNKYLLQAKELASLFKQKETEKEICFNLSKVYETNKQYDKALFYFKLMTEIKDSLINVETSRNIKSIELQYEAEKKDREFSYIQQKLGQQKGFRVITGSIILIFAALIAFLAIDNTRKRKHINKIVQRKAFLIKTLEHTIENQNRILQKTDTSPVRFFHIPKSNDVNSTNDVVFFSNDAYQVIITLCSTSSDLPLAAIKSFLLHELQKKLDKNNQVSNEVIVDIIYRKLFYTINLFDLNKKNIYHTILMVSCKNHRVDFYAHHKKLWVCRSDGAFLLSKNNALSFEKLDENEPILYPLSNSHSLNAIAFDEFLSKTAKTISSNNLQSKLDVLNNAVESWNLSESPINQMKLIAVSISCNHSVSINFIV